MAPGKRSAGTVDPRSPARGAVSERSVPDSPLKRLKAAILERRISRAVRDELILSSVEEFRRHVLQNETAQAATPDIDVIVTGTLLWKSTHSYDGRTFVRLHMTDAEPEASMEELAEFEVMSSSGAEDQALVDGILLTATVFGETADSPYLPATGSVIRISKSRKRMVYEGERCQLIARATDISVITEAP